MIPATNGATGQLVEIANRDCVGLTVESKVYYDVNIRMRIIENPIIGIEGQLAMFLSLGTSYRGRSRVGVQGVQTPPF